MIDRYPLRREGLAIGIRRQAKRADGRKPTSLATIGVLSVTGVWSYLVATIAARSTLMSGGDMPRGALSLVVAALALALGVRSATLVGEETAIVASRHKWSLQFFIALLGLLVFIAARTSEQQTGFRVDTLIHLYSLLIWLAVTLLVFTVLRKTRAVRR